MARAIDTSEYDSVCAMNTPDDAAVAHMGEGDRPDRPEAVLKCGWWCFTVYTSSV